MTSTFEFNDAFEGLTGHPPFPWQQRLFVDWLSRGELPRAIEIPTGLGKTAVMVVWILARASGADLPRRLVHVVDRHAVADHATEFAEDLRDRLQRLDALEAVRHGLGLEDRPLPISTLRGRFVGDREWMVDPSAPAIIVGTVETVGSQLLFEGHGLHRCLRPYAAGLMGCDTLVLLDEAHRLHAFEAMLRTIETGQCPIPGPATGSFAGRNARDALPPRLRVLPLFASPRCVESDAFGLSANDWADETVRRRLDAEKILSIEDLDGSRSLDAALAERAFAMMQDALAGGGSVRIAIFCDRPRDAAQVALRLRSRSKKERPEAAVIDFSCDRRVHEHCAATEKLKEYGLLAGSDAAPAIPVFLIATAAGEIAVDLDADHMVCDLVAWERMVLRLGRVNRRGLVRSSVLVIDQGPRGGGRPKPGDPNLAAVRALLAALPENGAGKLMAGPAVLTGLGEEGTVRKQIIAASTCPPLYPALTRPLVDAWAMTSLTEHPGRPEVGPWLCGWRDCHKRSTTVIWRRHLPVRSGSGPAEVRRQTADEAAEFFEAAPPHMAEGLETDAGLAAGWIRKRARRILEPLDPVAEPREGKGARGKSDRDGALERAVCPPVPDPDAPVTFILDSANRPVERLCLTAILEGSTRELERALEGRFLVVDARLRGLKDGMLNDRSERPVSTIEDGWGGGLRNDPGTGLPPFRVRETSDAERRARNELPTLDRWRETHATPRRLSPQGEIESWVVVEKPPGGGEGEESRAIAFEPQLLADHQAWAADEAARIGWALGLEEADRAMLAVAARRHDEGKRATRWQRALGADCQEGALGKTAGPVNRHILNGYRHELKSTLDAKDTGLGGIAPLDPRFDLALHLIASHHGNARPTIAVDGYDEMPPSAAEARAHEIAARFARLQRQWGPWGLAWWEALLRAADQSASRLHEAGVAPRRSEAESARHSHGLSVASAGGEAS